jgi:hypothetical protein
MRCLLPLVLVTALSPACGLLDVALDDVERNCDTRQPYYPDQDGDGVGATSPVFFGCEAPSGYVETTGDCDDDDPALVACDEDTGSPEETGDPGDTGPEDTATPADSRG